MYCDAFWLQSNKQKAPGVINNHSKMPIAKLLLSALVCRKQIGVRKMWFLAFICFESAVLSESMTPLSFLIGEWQTHSVYPDGTQAEGKLSYESVLGGDWIKFTFVGKHPTRAVWEAHGMIRAIDVGEFEAIVFFGPQEGSIMHGVLIDDGVFRLATSDGLSGIDYHPTETGVYQENWSQHDDARTITLRTTYKHLASSP